MTESVADVAVAIPVRNEAADLERSVRAVLAQDHPGRLEVCLAVAPSSDETAQVARRIADGDERVSVVDNPDGVTPAGLNAAIRATSAPVVVRVDGHSELCDGYIARALETLERTGAENVGGIQVPNGRTPFEVAVGRAMASRFGAGDARFHYGGEQGPVDTVYLGVFRREAIEAVGLFDETLIRNQDYELNWRLREAGGTIWFDPALRVGYRPRGSLRALARQYFEYGQWKRVVLGKHPRSLRWRQLAAPAALLGVLGGGAGGLLWPALLLLPLTYATALVMASVAVGRSFRDVSTLLAVYPTMHGAWGTGFLLGRRVARRTRQSSSSDGTRVVSPESDTS